MPALVGLFARLGIGFSRFLAGIVGKTSVEATLGNLAIIGSSTAASWLSNAFGWVTGNDDAGDEAESTITWVFGVVGALLLVILLILGWKSAKRAFK